MLHPFCTKIFCFTLSAISPNPHFATFSSNSLFLMGFSFFINIYTVPSASPMAFSSSSVFFVFGVGVLLTLMSGFAVSQSQLALNSEEQDSVYQVLESINPDIPWRSIFSDDICSSAPHGVVCDYFSGNADFETLTPHITELHFGYVSDYSPNPPCSPHAALNSRIFSSFKYLRKLFFYKCFTNPNSSVSVPEIPDSFGSSLEELVFIENPSLVGSLGGIIGKFTHHRLRRLVLTGTGVYGTIPDEIANLTNIQELTLSGNKLSGGLTLNLEKLNELKILDLSHNHFQGNVCDSLGRLQKLLKLDLSRNRFTGKIPENIKHLQRLAFLDLSYNEFVSESGFPPFLGQITTLREVHLSGNKLGGHIPSEIWENLGGILGIGLSEMGLIGNIPVSMGVFLRNLSYLRLDNNKLEGTVPEEFGFLEKLNELNLENNALSGRLPFSYKFASRIGGKLRLKGNIGLCVDEGILAFKGTRGSLGTLKICSKPCLPNPVQLHGVSSSSAAIHLDCFYLLMLLGFLFLLA